MKKIRSHIMLLAGLLVATSCDHGFDEINTSKTGALAINPVYQLNNAIINTSSGGAAGGSTLIYDIGIVQQIISPNSGVLTGANFNQDNREATQTLWQGYFRNVIRNTKDIINQTKDVPERSNLINMARILQAYGFMVLTHAYGDLPHVQAELRYIEQHVFPTPDPQQAIYPDLIQELKSAGAVLDRAGTPDAAGVLFGADIEASNKFANSLLLR